MELSNNDLNIALIIMGAFISSDNGMHYAGHIYMLGSIMSATILLYLMVTLNLGYSSTPGVNFLLNHRYNDLNW